MVHSRGQRRMNRKVSHDSVCGGGERVVRPQGGDPGDWEGGTARPLWRPSLRCPDGARFWAVDGSDGCALCL